jgi:hypothetical protein
MNERERFVDEIVARELARATETEPLDGLEDRLLAKLTAGRPPARGTRGIRFAWPWIAVATAAALIAIVLWWPARERHPALTTARTAGTMAPATPPTAAPRESIAGRDPESPAPPGHRLTPAEPAGPRQARRAPGQPRRIPERFPTPTRLSEQERLVQQLAATVPDPEQVLATHDRGFDLLRVSAITIEPLPPPGTEEETSR